MISGVFYLDGEGTAATLSGVLIENTTSNCSVGGVAPTITGGVFSIR